MHSFVRKHQQYALTGGWGRSRLYLYEPDDPLSTIWATLQAERSYFVSRSDAQRALAAESEETSSGKASDPPSILHEILVRAVAKAARR